MPTASEELRQEWRHYEPDGGDTYAIQFLRNRGFRQTRTWGWTHDDPQHVLTQKECSAMMYLVHEWDFGGLE